MFGKFFIGSAALALAATPSVVLANSTASLNLRLVVPVHCSVKYEGLPGLDTLSGRISLGNVREYCNASGGYELVMAYAPGSLRGATVQVGGEVIVLDGSGRAVLSRESGPKMQTRPVSILPGANGIDTSHLAIDILPVQG
jgi:hypothetical protein